MLKSRAWARHNYQGLKDPLKTPVKLPEIQVQGDFYTLGSRLRPRSPLGLPVIQLP